MKKLLLTLALLAGFGYVSASAHEHTPPTASSSADSAWLVKAKAEYPLKTCVVSGDDLGGEMGEAVDYVYHQEGKADRLVRFCCKKCIKSFEKEPAKYMKEIDEAAAQAKKH